MEDQTAALTAAAWAAHYIQVAAAMLLFGGSLFPFYSRAEGWPAHWRALGFFPLTAALFLSVALAAALKIADLTGDPATLLDAGELKGFFLETSFGGVWLLRLAVSTALFAVALCYAVKARLSRSSVRSRDAVLLSLSGLVLLTFAGGGHAGAVSGSQNAFAATVWEGLHLLAAGAWIGGLLPLLHSMGVADGHDGTVASAVRLLRSFSLMGQLTVGTLILGGFATLIVLMGAWHVTVQVLTASNYGQALIVKHALIAAMLVIAGVNRFVLLQRLEAGTARVSQMRRAILLECALAVLVIAAGVTLSQSPPPSDI
jgi:copper resistance protein D